MKTSCDIIRDLLPLYADHVTSDASNALVEEHLNECPNCRKELEQMQRPVPVKLEEVPAATLKKIKRDIHKKIICTVLAAVAIVACLTAVSTKLYNSLTIATAEEANIQMVVTEDYGLKVNNVRVMGDGVYLRTVDFDMNASIVSMQAVKYTYPKFHALLQPIASRLGKLIEEEPKMDDDRLLLGRGSSGSTIMVIECADDTLCYQNGQQINRYEIKRADGSIKYVYGTPDSIVGRRYGGE